MTETPRKSALQSSFDDVAALLGGTGAGGVPPAQRGVEELDNARAPHKL